MTSLEEEQLNSNQPGEVYPHQAMLPRTHHCCNGCSARGAPRMIMGYRTHDWDEFVRVAHHSRGTIQGACFF